MGGWTVCVRERAGSAEARSLMIAHVNPASGAAENSLDTLRYACRALLYA